MQSGQTPVATAPGAGIGPVVTGPVQGALQSLPLFLRELIAGGVAGGLGKSSVAPLERTKILFQTGRLSRKGVWATVCWLYQSEGVAGLYRGNGASVLRIVPYAAIHFSAYEYYRRWIIEGVAANWVGANGGRVHPVLDLVAGSAAGATAVAFTYPLDLVRTRLAWATESSLAATGATKHHIRSVISETFRLEGVRGLYHGMAPTMLGILPYAGLKFYVYQSLKAHYRSLVVSRGLRSAPGQVDAGNGRLPVPLMLLFGGAAGLAAQTVTYPLDVVRRRMQVEGLLEAAAAAAGTADAGGAAGSHVGMHPHKIAARSSIWQTVKLLRREGGTRALFRGLSINYMKVVPSTAIGFTTYDALKSYLGVVNNI